MKAKQSFYIPLKQRITWLYAETLYLFWRCLGMRTGHGNSTCMHTVNMHETCTCVDGNTLLTSAGLAGFTDWWWNLPG